jgi:hypothetical protein
MARARREAVVFSTVYETDNEIDDAENLAWPSFNCLLWLQLVVLQGNLAETIERRGNTDSGQEPLYMQLQ